MLAAFAALTAPRRRHALFATICVAFTAAYLAWLAGTPGSRMPALLAGAVASPASAHGVPPPPAAPSPNPADVDPVALAVAEEPPAMVFRKLTARDAVAVNAALPFWSGAIPPPEPFKLDARMDPTEHAQAVRCLAEAVYYEAGFEPLEGAQAVAQVVLNRVRHPLFPKTVCGVVFQGSLKPTGCQFTFTCDGARDRGAPQPAAWARAQVVATRALNGYVAAGVGQATHYHTTFVVPYWAPTLTKLTGLGAHIFYRWAGSAGRPGAFGGVYAGSELIAAAGARGFATLLVAAPAPATTTTATVAAAPTTSPAPVVLAAPAEITLAANAELKPAMAMARLQAPEVKLGPIAPMAAPAAMRLTPCMGPTCGRW